MQVIGSCHGILCLQVADDSIHLWNPCTRHSKCILNSQNRPSLGLDLQFSKVRSSGLGFDSYSNDIKFVTISARRRHVIGMSVNMYSVNDDSWKEVACHEDVHLVSLLDSIACVCRGVMYWVSGSKKLLLSFDLHDEVFGTSRLPGCCGDKSNSFNIINYKDSVALFTVEFGFEHLHYVRSLWTMDKEVDMDEVPWTKKFSFEANPQLVQFHCFLSTGQFVVEDPQEKELYLYDHENKLISYIEIGGIHVRSVFNYVESLVSIKGPERVQEEAIYGIIAEEEELQPLHLSVYN